MIEWLIIGGIVVAAAAATGGIVGYAASRRGYCWRLAFDPYWGRWVWVPTYF